ncbi:MAG: AtpZ/AtpI family protein [Oscillospiraceae bacterium]|nr:AtpZ/AtpI family protein [Oscillospiraceae bacterium]
MKDINMLVWLTQLGLSIAAPLAGFVLLALWLRSTFGLGSWVIWVGLALGLYSALAGFRQSLQAMERMSRDKKSQKPPPISFNEHN